MASIIRSLVSMVSKEEGDSISEDEQQSQPPEARASLDRQISSSSTNNNETTNIDNTTKPNAKKKKDKTSKKAEKKAMKKAKKKAAKRLEKEERKRCKKEERKRLKKDAKKLEKKKLLAAVNNGGESSSDIDMNVDIDNSIDETNSANSTTSDSNKQSQPTTYITTSNSNQNQILQLIPNHIKNNFRTIGFSKWGNGSKGNWLPILELGPFDVEEGPVRDCWFELAEQAQETGRSMSRLIFWYGVKFEDRTQAYSFVSESKVISYEQGKLQGYNVLPTKIANKLKKKQHLTKIEEQIHRGLMEVELDVKKEKIDRGLLWLTASKKEVYKVGTRVVKNFFDDEIGKIRSFAGTVERYDAKKKIYHILYEDGDTDMLYELEVKEILVKGGDKKPLAVKTIQDYEIGTKVSKSFFDEEMGEIRPFAGSVVSFDAKKKYYKVVYEDGDAEDLFGSDVKEIVVKDKTPTKRSSKKRKANEQLEEFEVVETTSGRWAGSVTKRKRRRNGNGDYVHVYLCKEEGCTNHSKNGGVCIKHGAQDKRYTCKHVGCNKYPRRGGFCVIHGGSRS